MFLFYIGMLVCCYLIYKDTIKNEQHLSKGMKWTLGILFFIFVIINPMIIGFYHTLLTEFIAITLAVLGCYLSWKWIGINFSDNKLKYCIYTISIAILTSIAWHLKQPYVGTILFPVVIAALISFIRNVNLKNFIQRATTLVVCAIVLIFSINVWNLILDKNNVNIKQDRTSSGFFASGILRGITEYEIQEIREFNEIKEVEENTKIKEEDKEKIKQILENNSEYKSFTVIDTNNENYEIIYSKQKAISISESIKFWMETLVKEPKVIIDSYITNYLATISLYDIDFDGLKIIINKKINMTGTKEINDIAYRIYEYGKTNVLPLTEEFDIYATEYKETGKPIVAINWVMKKLELPCAIVMKISFLILPLLTICSIILVFRTKKRYNSKYCRIIDMITILFTFSFLHILVHALLGSTIDRYTIPVLATTFLGILLSIYAVVYRKKYKIENNNKVDIKRKEK